MAENIVPVELVQRVAIERDPLVDLELAFALDRFSEARREM